MERGEDMVGIRGRAYPNLPDPDWMMDGGGPRPNVPKCGHWWGYPRGGPREKARTWSALDRYEEHSFVYWCRLLPMLRPTSRPVEGASPPTRPLQIRCGGLSLASPRTVRPWPRRRTERWLRLRQRPDSTDPGEAVRDARTVTSCTSQPLPPGSGAPRGLQIGSYK